MIGSIELGTVLGIRVRVHWLLVVLVVVLAWAAALGGMRPLEVLALLGVLFGVVFLHELGHCLMARRFGIRVLDITFWPLGGMARMSEIPEDSRVESLIAIAGPAVNFALAFLAAPLWFWSNVAAGRGDATAFVVELALLTQAFVSINLMLGLFNLIPAFPMDGGRLLRAWLGRRGDWVGATERAVRVGRWFALLMVAGGLLLGLRGANMLPVIGLFVWISGSRELAVVRARHSTPRDPLFDLGAAFGLGRRAAPEPAVRYDEAPGPPQSAAADPSGARRPAAPWSSDEGPGSAEPRSGRRRFSPEELERLEHHPGPLLRAEPE